MKDPRDEWDFFTGLSLYSWIETRRVDADKEGCLVLFSWRTLGILSGCSNCIRHWRRQRNLTNSILPNLQKIFRISSVFTLLPNPWINI